MKHFSKILLSCIALLLFACAGLAIDDTHYVLDPPNHNLRGKAPKDDLSEEKCDPEKQPDGKLKYKCVVHFFADYDKLLNEIARLQTELKSCQQAHQ